LSEDESPVGVVAEDAKKRTRGVNLLRVMRAMDVEAEIMRALPRVAPEAKIGPRKCQVLASCFEEAFEAYMHRFESHRSDGMRTRAKRKEDSQWPPQTMLGVRLSLAVEEDAMREAGEFELTDTIVDEFVFEHGQSLRYGVDDNALEVEVRAGRLAGVVADAVCQRALATLRSELDRIRANSKQEIEHSLDADLRGTIPLVFTEIVGQEYAEVRTVQQLEGMVEAMRAMYSDYYTTSDQFDTVMENASMWIRNGSTMSTEDFGCWFLANFKRVDKAQGETADEAPTDHMGASAAISAAIRRHKTAQPSVPSTAAGAESTPIKSKIASAFAAAGQRRAEQPAAGQSTKHVTKVVDTDNRIVEMELVEPVAAAPAPPQPPLDKASVAPARSKLAAAIARKRQRSALDNKAPESDDPPPTEDSVVLAGNANARSRLAAAVARKRKQAAPEPG